jgi:hypothetical protein
MVFINRCIEWHEQPVHRNQQPQSLSPFTPDIVTIEPYKSVHDQGDSAQGGLWVLANTTPAHTSGFE